MGEINDLWKFNSCMASSMSVASITSLLCAGSTATLLASGATSYIWNGLQSGTSLAINQFQTVTQILVGSNAVIFVQAVTQNLILNLRVTGNNVSCAGVITNFSASGAVIYLIKLVQNAQLIVSKNLIIE